MGTEQVALQGTGPTTAKGSGALARFVESPWAVGALLALALALRLYQAPAWSLWEDEETSVYFSQQLGKPFPQFFPLFFLGLRALFEVTGVSVTAGRCVSALLGVVGVGVTYFCARRLTGRSVALVAALLLTLNMGHLFWSQSIRYFVGLYSLQLLSLYWFLDGLERGKTWQLVLSNVAYALCLLTHFSALLMTPVFVTYLFLMVCTRQSGGGYGLRGYLTFGLVHAAVVAAFVVQIARAKAFMSGAPSAVARDPVHLVINCVSYFGLPAVGLGLLAPWLRPLVPRRILWFLLTVSLLPVLELAVMAGLKLTNVTWYNAFFSLGGFVILAALALVSLHRAGFRRLALAGGGLAVLYSAVFLAGYYTVMHGDRPRWKDAAGYLREAAHVRPEAADNPEIFANVPGVVAFYLGVPPGETMDSRLVRMLPDDPPASPPEREQWYVVEAGHASPQFETWLAARCTLEAEFAARTGPRERTVRMFHYAGASSAPATHE
jgi:uncharacterized membrane protein